MIRIVNKNKNMKLRFDVKMKVVWIIGILLILTHGQDAENFTYWEFDSITIKPNSNIGIYGSLTTLAD